MFLGHYAAAFAAKRAAPDLSLGTLVFAAQWLDLLWPLLLLAGVEHVRIVPGITAVTPLDLHHMPWSHSLLAVAGWAVLFGLIAGGPRRSLRTGVVVAACVASHWALDAVVHRPDLPLTPWGEERIGLRLWDSWPATLAIELGLFAAGVALYLGATRAEDRAGRWRVWALIGFLLLAAAAAWAGPPPPGETPLALAALALWLLVPAAAWADKRREPAPQLERD
jgi:hypothetical protein